MKLFVPKDYFNNPTPPRLFLCTTGGKRMQELSYYEGQLNAKWVTYSEISFSIDRMYVDVLTGETKVHPAFDKTESLRLVEAENLGVFVLQDQDDALSDKDSKTMSAFSLEYSMASKYLENFYINTGEDTSKEVIYWSSIHGDSYYQDERYVLATGDFDAYESYYIQQYSNTNSYIYEQVQIADEQEYAKYIAKNNDLNAQPHEKLYVRKYPNVRFYFPSKPELSLLHLIFEKLPEWKIGNVDVTLWRKERKFSEDRVAVYDFLANNIVDTFNCVVEFDTLARTVNFYEEADDGITEDNTIQSRFQSDIYISRDNLANQLDIKVSADNIKTKLKVSGSDGLDIREVNLGKNYIMNLDYYHNDDWMEPELLEAYDDYLDAVEEHSPKYIEAMQGWVAAYNKWNDLMNAVPAEGNVVLVGDDFKKLYCLYTPIDDAYLQRVIDNSDVDILVVDNLYDIKDNGIVIDKTDLADGTMFVVQGYAFKYVKTNDNFKCVENMNDNSVTMLTGTADNQYKDGKLHMYGVDEDVKANNNDNVLLKLKNSNSDIATIRIYNGKSEEETAPHYFIQVSVINSSTGAEELPKIYNLYQWVSGQLTANMMGLEGYKITYIGIMGAYFVLAKDETKEATLEEYGVNLLKEKHNTYIKIFQTQTEQLYSQEEYQCIVQNEEPTEKYEYGTKWLDTNSNPVKLYEADGNGNWVEFTTQTVSPDDERHYMDYQRYMDNYNKMVAVQKMLLQKEKDAEYWLNGYIVVDRVINYQEGDSDVAFYAAADAFFRTSDDAENASIISRKAFTTDVIPIYTFTTVKANGTFAVYLKGSIPYVAYADSQGICQAKRDAVAKLTEFESFFTKEQWISLSLLIREDEYNDDNFLLTGYESEEERLEICKELMESASKELKTLSQPSLEFSMTMANILALPEFEPITSQFALGNFIRIELRPGVVKRARLLECTINFDDFSDFSCTFGNLITTKSEIDLHAELLKQAVTAGKTVATAADDWQRAVEKSNKLEESISSGLQDVALQIGRASGQAISWDENGFFARKFKDGSTNEFEDQQIAIINNKLVFTNDGWKTSKAALGAFEADINGDGIPEQIYGLLAEAVVGGYIKGSVIEGGSLKIGDENKEGGSVFIVNEDGSVEIKTNGQDKYASKNAVDAIDNAYRFRIVLSYDKLTVFSDTNQDCTITCNVYDYDTLITDKVIAIGGTFSWIRSSLSSDEDWNASHVKQGFNANIITLKTTDVVGNSNFSCIVDFDETKLTI